MINITCIVVLIFGLIALIKNGLDDRASKVLFVLSILLILLNIAQVVL